MTRNLSRILLAGVAASMLIASPIEIATLGLGVAMAEAKGHGQPPGKAKKEAKADTTKVKGPKNKVSAAASPDDLPEEEPAPNAKGKLHAKLAGLNSLNRNVNGLMNSSDPRMVDVRAFVIASADLAAAREALPGAEAGVSTAQGAYDAMVGGLMPVPYDGVAYTDTSLTALGLRLDALTAAGATDPLAATEAGLLAEAIADIQASAELAALNQAQDDLDAVNQDIATGEAATTDEMLIEALMVAANDNRVAQYGDGYVDPELLAWAKAKLGVGDAVGTIDAYIAAQ